jgi:hypothetical protein
MRSIGPFFNRFWSRGNHNFRFKGHLKKQNVDYDMWKMTLKQEVIQETIDKEKQITE